LCAAAAGIIQRRWGEVGMYEHGGGPLCRPHLARTSPAHAHVHVLPICADIVGALPARLRRTADNGFAGGPHYLWQKAGLGGAERTSDLTAVTSPHITRTLLQLAHDERARTWIPLGAPAASHAGAIAETRAVFAGTRVASGAPAW
jgi:hypothetical protein